MKRILYNSLIICALMAFACACRGKATVNEEVKPDGASVEAGMVTTDTVGMPLYAQLGIPTLDYEIEEDVVKKNELFATILQRRGVPYTVVHQLTEVSQGTFDMRKLRVGQSYTLLYLPNGSEPRYMVYEENVRSHVCFSLQDSLWVSRYQIPITVEQRSVEVTITHSLWQDLSDAGANPLVAIPLSEVYAWTIDFFGLQKGDSIKAYYQAYMLNGKELEPGPIVAASFTHGGQTYKAFRYVQDSVAGYWNFEGENLQKAFLKAPLRYSRISSGFSYARRHPITRVVRPHTGVDYAAPTGTPVMSIGDGTVIAKGYAGGGGNTVRIKHNSVYTTAYLHLSKYAKGLAVGQRVSQGQVIGYVGSTGSSTGPHLDFRVWQNGKPINPLTMESPPADPIHEGDLERFQKDISFYNRQLTAHYYKDIAYALWRKAGLEV